MNNQNEEKAIQYSLLSDKGILRHMKLGNIIIEPYNEHNLSTSSYDGKLKKHIIF